MMGYVLTMRIGDLFGRTRVDFIPDDYTPEKSIWTHTMGVMTALEWKIVAIPHIYECESIHSAPASQQCVVVSNLV